MNRPAVINSLSDLQDALVELKESLDVMERAAASIAQIIAADD